MAGRGDLELHYPARAPDLWKEDLRTATFLVRRDDDTFAFAHTSLREFFLARYLLRALQLGAVDAVQEAWSMPVPSRETLGFLGQLLASLDAEHARTCRGALAALARSAPGSPAAVLAFGYGLATVAGGHPHHTLAGSRLDGADLRGWRMEAPDGVVLDLRGTSFAGADLSGAVLRTVDLRDADLTGADLARTELHDCGLRGTDLRAARLTGTILRRCELNDARWGGSTAPGSRLTALTGHTGPVRGGGFSPDGSRVLTTSYDQTARIWDAATGEQIGWQLQQLPDGQAAVWSVPDHRLIGASTEAWRWLGWLTPVDGALVRLPAETYAALPPLGPGTPR